MKGLLIHTPFAAPEYPSISLSTIQSVLIECGCEVRVYYSNLEFLNWLINNGISQETIKLLLTRFGEVVFAIALRSMRYGMLSWTEFISEIVTFSENYRHNVRKDLNDSQVKELYTIIQLSIEYMNEFANSNFTTGDIEFVGCTTGFVQHYSSIAMLWVIKQYNPAIKTFMGGFCCDGEMGKAHHQLFPWIDYVFSGEGENSIVSLINRLETQDCINVEDLPSGVYGPMHRIVGYEHDFDKCWGTPVNDLDNLPIPIYDDYFSQLKLYKWVSLERIHLLYECSRGCWWKRHDNGCKFCGTEEKKTAHYRCKTHRRIAEELIFLCNAYGVKNIIFTDLVIPIESLRRAAGALSELGLNIFCEVRVNTSKDDLTLLRKIGVKNVQVGIESLSDDCLLALHKGSTTLQNIEFLRNCLENRILVEWNMLGFLPVMQDKSEWYHEINEIIPWIMHLPPPNGQLTPIELIRFSQFFQDAKLNGVIIKENPAESTMLKWICENNNEDYHYYFVYTFVNSKDNIRRFLITQQIERLNASIRLWIDSFIHNRLSLCFSGLSVIEKSIMLRIDSAKAISEFTDEEQIVLWNLYEKKYAIIIKNHALALYTKNMEEDT